MTKVSEDYNLAVLYPKVAKQWHPTKNGEVGPESVAPGSGKKFWWECSECGNEWLAIVGNRTRLGAGCSVCSEKKRSESSRRPEKGRSLLDEFPELCKEWHPEKNGDKTPDEYHPGSNRTVWWKCPEGPDHEWKTAVSNRSSGSRTCCPCCSRPARQLSVTNCLGSLYPGVAEQWHPTKNGNLTPNDVIANTQRKVWWHCLKNPEHEWQAQCYSVVKAWSSGTSGCPGCSQKMVSSTHNLAVVYPELAKEWHPTKNKNLLPEDVLPHSTKKCWWKCIYCGSEWAARPHERKGRRGKPGCPSCASIEARKAMSKAKSTPKPGRSLQDLHPLLAERWHPTKNDGLKPTEISEKSHRKVWWKCPKGPDHEWQSTSATVVEAWKNAGKGCPYCSGKRASITNSLAVILPEIAEEWHPTKNGELTPDKITPGSNKKIWWKCQKNHTWPAKISNRTSTNATGCPYCAESSNRVDSTNNLAVLHPELIKGWHPKNKQKPEEFRPGSNRKVWWICNKGPDHEWKATIASRVQGTGCPCCSGHKLSVTNSLATNFPEIAKEWHPTKNDDTPDNVIAGSGRKVWWLCSNDEGHEWITTVTHRTSSDKTACPYCQLKGKSKIEIRIAFELYDLFNLEYVLKPIIKVKDTTWFPDIVIESISLVVEYDGNVFHGEDVFGGENRVKFDRLKTEKLQDAGWTVIRVRENPLEKITDNDIIVASPDIKNYKIIIDKIIKKMTASGIQDKRFEEYLEMERPIARRKADEYIAKLLKDQEQTTLDVD